MGEHYREYYENRASVWIISVAIAIACLFGTVISWHRLEVAHDNELRKAHAEMEKRAETMNIAVEQYVEMILISIDNTLRQLRLAYIANPKAFDQTAKEAVQNLPLGLVRFVTVFDTKGELIYSSNGTDQHFNAQDREHFRVHTKTQEDKLFISQPLEGRITGERIIQLTRPIWTKDGRFLGVIGLPLRPNFVAERLNDLHIEPSDVISIVHMDGSFVSRSRNLEEALKTKVSSKRPYLSSGSGESGLFRDASTIDKMQLTFSWRRMSRWPLAVIVGVDERPQLANLEQKWHEERQRMLMVIAAIVLLTSAIVLLLQRIVLHNRNLHESQSRLRQLFEKNQTILRNASDGICILNAAGGVTEASDSFCTMLGDTRHTMIGTRIADYWDSHNPASSLDKEITRIFACGKRIQFESVCRTRHGVKLPIEVSVIPFHSDGEDLLFCAIRDITRHKEQDALLNEERRRIRDILEGTHVGTWEWNVQTGAVILNERWAEMIGYTLEELQPITIQTWVRFAHPDDLPHSTRLLEQHFAGEIPHYECEARMRHKNGQWVWVLDRGKVASWTKNKKPLLMSGTHQDITARKEASEALLRSERFMRSLINILPGTIGYWDSNLHCSFANSTYLQWFGRTPEEIRGIHMRELLGEAAFKANEPHILAALSGIPQHFERKMTRDNVRPVYVLVQYIPDVVDGQVRGFFAQASDVTTIKLAQFDLETANAMLQIRSSEAEAANRTKSAFLATMSHEIRTPLNAIIGMGYLLQQSELDGQQREQVRAIQVSGNNLLALVNDVLDVSKIEAGAIVLESIPIALDALCDEMVLMFSSTAHHKGLTFRIEPLPATLPTVVEGDPIRIKQMLINLLGNAIKFTEQGTVQLVIQSIQSLNHEEKLRFSVRDTGIGITSEQQDKLFKPFSQADASTTRKYGGTGLGLSIVRQLAELMGGQAGIDDPHGHGSTFWFEIPLKVSTIPAPIHAVETVHVVDAVDVVIKPSTSKIALSDAELERVQPLIAELECMLDENRMDALLLSRTIETALKGTLAEILYQGVSQRIGRLQYAEARAELATLKEQLCMG